MSIASAVKTRPRVLWLKTAAGASGGVVAYALSVAVVDSDALGMLLFVTGPAALIWSGSVGRWRAPVASFLAAALLVLLFPESRSEPQQDPDACDPFCGDPVAGLEWAIGLGLAAAVLAGLGWLLTELAVQGRVRLRARRR